MCKKDKKQTNSRQSNEVSVTKCRWILQNEYADGYVIKWDGYYNTNPY